MYKFLLLILLMFLSLQAEDYEVLFIGNSYTYCNNLPKTFQRMAELSGHKMNVRMEAPGGYRFHQHLKRKQSLAAIHSQKWDAVFLQNQSFAPVNTPDIMMKSGEQLAQEIRKKSERIILYQTMAYSGKQGWLLKIKGETRERYEKMHAEMFPRLEKTYNSLAKKISADVAPAGKAWQLIHEIKSELKLHTGDKSHPNAMGSYLNALVFYGVFFNKQAKGFQLGPFSKEAEEKNEDLKELRWLLEEAAWEAIKKNQVLLSKP